MNKREFKKSKEELRGYLQFKRHGYLIENRKGKGSYKRYNKYKKPLNADD